MNHKLSNQQFVSLVDFKDARIEALISENDKIKKENAKLKAFVKKSNGSLEWWSLYGACVSTNKPNADNFACQYADEQMGLLTDNGLNAEEVREYYLNSGFPEYEEEPYTSYTDADWIECANENDLER